MKVNLVQYNGLAKVGGAPAPIGEQKLAGQTLTADGTFTALDPSAKLIRVATDTTIYFARHGTATSASVLILANSAEWFAVNGGETPNFITAP